jgi:TolB protein
MSEPAEIDPPVLSLVDAPKKDKDSSMKKSPLVLIALFCFGVLAQSTSYTDESPAISPDGLKIAFTSDRDGDIEIYSMDIDGTHPRRLTYAPGRDAHPTWSQDGKLIYFQSPRDRTMPQIFVMSANGDAQKPLTSNPDGARILYMVDQAPTPNKSHWQICLMNSDGSGQRNLAPSDFNDQVPRWSKDGKHILFYSDQSGGDQLYAMNADGTSRQMLTSGPGSNKDSNWSPDGSRIVFKSNRSGKWAIYVIRAREEARSS